MLFIIPEVVYLQTYHFIGQKTNQSCQLVYKEQFGHLATESSNFRCLVLSSPPLLLTRTFYPTTLSPLGSFVVPFTRTNLFLILTRLSRKGLTSVRDLLSKPWTEHCRLSMFRGKHITLAPLWEITLIGA